MKLVHPVNQKTKNKWVDLIISLCSVYKVYVCGSQQMAFKMGLVAPILFLVFLQANLVSML